MNKNKQFNEISRKISNHNDYNQIHKLLDECSKIIFEIQIEKIRESRDVFFNLWLNIDDPYQPTQGACFEKLSTIIYRFVENDPYVITKKHINEVKKFLYSDEFYVVDAGISILHIVANTQPELITSDLITEIEDIAFSSNVTFPSIRTLSNSILSTVN